MINKNNPVGRLLKLIEQVQELRNDYATASSLTKREAWGKILDMEEASEMELVRAMLDVSDLARRSRVLIASFSPNPDLFLLNFENVELTVLPNELNRQFENTCSLISDDTITRLAFASDMLSEFYDEGEVSENELKDISQLITELYDEVKASNFEVAVKTFLLEALEGIRRSVAHYEIYGAKGIRDAFQTALGGVVANKDELQATNHKGIVEKFGTALTKLDKATATAFKAKEVLGKSLKLLGIVA
ncbi:hypothetical protein [Thalassomonas sp. RHCl1]|uniref:hypothetical protein n=1 Tax=Thalassomonas sp. RHCl1 TaxID=2995320 RepID=UPI00248B541B|nr:hypothetical protein [Thalassomonas sp. RHCl1]